MTMEWKSTSLTATNLVSVEKEVVNHQVGNADVDILHQLTKCIAIQNEESATANQLRCKELTWKKKMVTQIEKDF